MSTPTDDLAQYLGELPMQDCCFPHQAACAWGEAKMRVYAIDAVQRALAAQQQELERMQTAVDDAEGMAGCMAMLKDDLVRMGLIPDSTPPMFMTEAVCSALRKAAAPTEAQQRQPLTPDDLADKCEVWLNEDGRFCTNIVDAYEAGYLAAQQEPGK